MIITAPNGRSFWPARTLEVGASDPMAALARKIDRLPTEERQRMIDALSGPMPGRRDVDRILARSVGPGADGMPMLRSAMGSIPGFD